jgi:hypothetical protein
LGRKVFHSREETRYFSLLYLHRLSCSFNRLYCYVILYCTTLFCTIFYCTPLYYSVHYYNTLYSSVLYHTVSCTVIQSFIYATLSILYITTFYCNILYYAVLYYDIRYCSMLCCTFRYRATEADTGSLNSI